ncbi:T9SS type A sorting domain-containing protein [Reichenbachiella sp. MSK19-1]|uniref:T9SS type A sorting domain-containing protein n=1 Tax=Reichenbachiella sp. MSK19-1 TaxID=1897631 RepID=UPI000EDBFE89|nr:T9SS type A sorting domain-containing protein [Reichenbachiella sp. MSK19-1]RJE70434.1 hypothetical protein BGP76_10090 [Reichenbachiella sp. MSK19-1]
MKSKHLIFSLFMVLGHYQGYSQCTGTGNQTDYGSGNWIAYVYDGTQNYTTDFRGRYSITTSNFDTDICGGNNCTFDTNSCTDILAETISIRLKMNETYTRGIYRITIGGDDGVRLSLDGGSSFVLSDFSTHAYRESYTEILLDGNYNLVFDYFEASGGNRFSIQIDYLGDQSGGEIGSDQDICQFGAVDPDPFTSNIAAQFISELAPVYLWQTSVDEVTWSDIPLSNTENYDAPAGVSGTLYYRRSAESGGVTVYSNTLTIKGQEPAGDEVTYGDESWIGYVYDGQDDFMTDYRGEIFETDIFDESFGGADGAINTTGCDVDATSFSVRFKMRKTFEHGEYTLTIGGDDGVRLSLDGGATYIIDDYSNHGYRTVDAVNVELNGAYDMVLEYYEGSGENRVSFQYAIETSLPVTYLFMKASTEGNGNLIQWATASETNNDYFELERTIDGDNWDVIAVIAGHGNSSSTITYEYMDSGSAGLSVYYRLRQVDYDGKYEYSDIISVKGEHNREEPVCYPNPAMDQVRVNWDGHIVKEIVLYDLTGDKVRYAASTTDVDLVGLDSGYYLVQVLNAMGQTNTLRLLVR